MMSKVKKNQLTRVLSGPCDCASRRTKGQPETVDILWKVLPRDLVEGLEASEEFLERVNAHGPKCSTIHPSIHV